MYIATYIASNYKSKRFNVNNKDSESIIMSPLYNIYKTVIVTVFQWAVTIHWTGILDWNTGLDYRTGVFSFFREVIYMVS